jgi:hypothetical protein
VFWRSKQVALVLIGSSAALAGFSSLAVHQGRWSSTTQPTTRSSGYGSSSHYYHSGHYYGGGYSGSSYSSGSSHGSSTSHGGFGSTGHAAHS